MLKTSNWLYIVTVLIFLIGINGCSNTKSTDSNLINGSSSVHIDPIEPPTGANFCTVHTCKEEPERIIKSVLRNFSDPSGYGTYVYLIITDKTDHLPQIQAAADSFMCNFDGVGEVSHTPIGTALFVAKTKRDQDKMTTGSQLLESYDLNSARVVHRLLKRYSTNIGSVDFDDNSNIYLLGSYNSLALFTEDEMSIAASMTFRADTPGSIQVIPLDHYTPKEIATLFKSMRKMYFEDSISETDSYLGLSEMLEPSILTFLRTVLRSVPLPSSKAYANRYQPICV
ncbi:MAG: hypothetical protein ACI83B_001831 [Sediminicola sp.]|jgi:hypothetical protein